MSPRDVPFVLSLGAAIPPLALAGGKGQALARMKVAGLPVPEGFLISTHGYRAFALSNALQQRIPAVISGVGGISGVSGADPAQADPSGAESAAAEVGRLFVAATLPEELVAAIVQAYRALGDGPVAVRSSATTEDLPELSFAGQQDSYLNVRGEADLLDAVRRCWASLWSARAIVYRTNMNVPQDRIAMGVVVQKMVDADVSGVLFTANPISGERSEILVNVGAGLGEALVGGQMTAATRILDRDGLREKTPITSADQEPLVDLQALARLCLEAEAVMGGSPQDLEWAVAAGRCWLLQSRPITSLPKTPMRASWEAPYPGARLVRRQVVENMPDPLSPLFEELYLAEGLDRGMDQLTSEMGLPVNMDDFIARPLFITVNGYGYCRYEFRPSWRMLLLIPKVLIWYVFSMPGWLKNLVPRWEQGRERYLETIREWQSSDPAGMSDVKLLCGVRELARADATYWFHITMMVGAAKVTEGLLASFLSKAVPGNLTTAELLRGFPSAANSPEEELESIADQIRGPIIERALNCRAEALLEVLEGDPASGAVRTAFDTYLARYGHQVYNLDFVEPTTAERPAPILQSLQRLVRDRQSIVPWVERRSFMADARNALEQSTRSELGPVRRWIFDKILGWARKFGPYREQALFYMGAGWPTLRQHARTLGERLRSAGTLQNVDEVFYLNTGELEQARLARQQHESRPDLGELARQRMALREARKRLHPPGRVPEDLRFKVGPLDVTSLFEIWETQKRNSDEANLLSGFAVSPGKVTGIASVILTPADFDNMEPGTILVCPTTTPAWTPLFGQAIGLVTDIGSLLAHGSIVAREYGIPAVLGIGNATLRIGSGQRIEVDGDSGTVRIVEQES